MSFVTENETVVTVNNYDELWEFVSQLTEEDFCVISYPITVQFEDGTQQTANSDEEFLTIKELPICAGPSSTSKLYVNATS